ncbi:hypothetical protein [Actinoplanes subglobosus]|uniref:Uncharacterized protein n=1 Tax=Actinoplanes subglobosus TaxID=1547892 RepID=A0ABV8J9X7_9ACTN
MRGRRWFLAALVLTAVVSAALLVLPLYAYETATGPAASSGEVGAGYSYERGHRSLLAVEGPGVAFLLAVPVLVSGLPVLVRGRRQRLAGWVSTALLSVGVLVGIASIGLFYLPGVLLSAIGTALSRTE